MCSEPIKISDDVEVACRRCNQCLTARKSDWVARAMAESKTSNYMMAIGLTYSEDNQVSRDGSKVFHYRHVSLFIKNLRRQIEHHYKIKGDLRFLCAGEMGSGKGRVHWHLILYTNVDLMGLGKWIDFTTKQDITDCHRDDKLEKRVNWSMWKHGHSHVQQSDMGGVLYCLKYIFKDQFNIVKSAGTMREARAENYSASLFRMSKKPPIGFIWLQQKLERLRDLRAVVPSLELKIEGMSGYWYPKGAMREYLILTLRDINEQILKETGYPAPQWSSLVKSLWSLKNKDDYERLVYGEVQEKEEFDFEKLSRKLEAKAQAIEEKHRLARATCKSFYPCSSCERGLTDQQVEGFTRWSQTIAEEAKTAGVPTVKYYWDRYETNPFCNKKPNP